MPSDAVTIALIAAAAPCCLIIVQGYMQSRRDNVRKDAIDSISEKVDSVKETGEANHVLQNSAALSQLKLTAIALDSAAIFAERIAMDGEKGDKAAARAARAAANEAHKIFDEHQEKQNIVDTMPGFKPKKIYEKRE